MKSHVSYSISWNVYWIFSLFTLFMDRVVTLFYIQLIWFYSFNCHLAAYQNWILLIDFERHHRPTRIKTSILNNQRKCLEYIWIIFVANLDSFIHLWSFLMARFHIFIIIHYPNSYIHSRFHKLPSQSWCLEYVFTIEF